MKIIAKALLILILLSGNSLFAQKIEIMVVGSSHENKPGYEDYEKVVGKLKDFKPDMVFGEYLSVNDYNALEPGIWAYKMLKKSQDFIARAYPEKIKNLDKKIISANKALNKSSDLHKLRMDLASYYVMHGDRANAEYQFFIIEDRMKKDFDNEEKVYYEQHFGNPDSIKKAGLYRPFTEYTNIYFPLLYTLKQERLYAMDCQQYDIAWSKASELADSAIKVLRERAAQDKSSAEAKTWDAIARYSSITEEDKKLMTNSPYYNMAHDRSSVLIEASNFYGGSSFYNYAGFPDQLIKDMYRQWNLRNEGMCANILRQAKEKNVRKVVVGVGAAHRKVMEDILSKDPDVKIIRYNELP